jgi:histidinol-phosphatase (PHP family)
VAAHWLREAIGVKVDYHVHLEEGPYSLGWLNRTAEALRPFFCTAKQTHSREWLDAFFPQLAERLRNGAFSAEWLDLYRLRAKQVGLAAVGVVDHLYRFREYKAYYEAHLHLAGDQLGGLQRRWLEQVCVTSLDDFVTFVEGQKQRWAEDGIELKVGIELDYFPGGEAVLADVTGAYPWDYCIGSVHFLQGWGFDNPDTRERFQQTDLYMLYGRYFSLVEQAVSSRLFDVVAHPDSLKAFGYRPDEAALLSYYQRIARALKETGTATEINTGLLYRYPVREMCPSLRFLEILAQHGVAVTTSSDAHFPDQVGHHLDEARELLKRAGFRTIAVFDRRRLEQVDLF